MLANANCNGRNCPESEKLCIWLCNGINGSVDEIRDDHIQPERRTSVPLPSIQCLRYHLDSCDGINKSLNFLNYLALLVSASVCDVVRLVFMVAGQIKFGPHLVTQASAGRYKKGDNFYHSMLNNRIEPSGTAVAYDEHLLHTWRRGMTDFFPSVKNLATFRNFLIVTDEKKVDFGNAIQLPTDLETSPFIGHPFSANRVQPEIEKLSERNQLQIFP